MSYLYCTILYCVLCTYVIMQCRRLYLPGNLYRLVEVALTHNSYNCYRTKFKVFHREVTPSGLNYNIYRAVQGRKCIIHCITGVLFFH